MITAMAPVAALVQVRCLAWALPCAADKAQKTSKAFLLIPFFSFLIFCAFKFYFAFFFFGYSAAYGVPRARNQIRAIVTT